MNTENKAEFDKMFLTDAELRETLSALGVVIKSHAEFPSTDTFDLPVSIVPRGNTTILLCKTDAAFDTLANHGARRNKTEPREVSGAKYMAIPTKRLVPIFESIARMRLLHSGNESTVRAHQKLAPAMAAKWIAALPVESDPYYIREIAADKIVAEVDMIG